MGQEGGCNVQGQPAVEVSGLLPVELTFHSAAVFGGPEPLESIVNELCILLVEVLVGHHIRGAGIDFVTAHLAQDGVGGGERKR